MKTEILQQQIGKITNEIAQFEAEFADIRNKMSVAANSGDGDKIVTLKQRNAELPTLIESARIRLCQKQIEADELRLPELQARTKEFFEPIAELIKKRDAAQLELAKMQGAYHSVNEDAREISRRIGERRRELSKLIHFATPQGQAFRVMPNMSGR
jgi:chromosome segregation ATPase